MNILIVDDHPMVLDFYEKVLEEELRATEALKIFRASNCKKAYDAIITAVSNGQLFDLALLDQRLPGYSEDIQTGSDIVELFKKYNQCTPCIIITQHTETIVVYDILKKANPNGLAIKNDLTAGCLIEMIKTVLNGDTYQSPMVKECVSEIWKQNVMAEENNRKILIYLSQGYKIKEMETMLELAPRTIKRRLTDIKKAFNVSDHSTLIRAVIQQGFLAFMMLKLTLILTFMAP